MSDRRNRRFIGKNILGFAALAMLLPAGCASDDATPEKAPNVDKILNADTSVTAPVGSTGKTGGTSVQEYANEAAGGDAQLEALLRYAAIHAPEMINQEHIVASNDPFRFRGWRQYMPFVNASYQAGYYKLLKGDINANTKTDKFGGSYNVSAQYPLYHWGALEAEKEGAFIREKKSQLGAAIAWRYLTGKIRDQYYSLIILKSAISLQEKRVKNAELRRELSKDLLETGKITAADRLNNSIEIKSVSLELERLKIALDTRLAELQTTSGATDFSPDTLPESVQYSEIDHTILQRQLARFKATGFEESTDKKINDLSHDELDAAIKAAEARHYPTFNLGFTVSQQPTQTSKDSFLLQTIFSAGIMGTWSLFDRDNTNTTINSLKARQRLLDANYMTTKTTTFSSLDAALKNLASAQEMIDLRRQYLAARERDMSILKEKLLLGQIAPNHVEQAQEGVDSTRHLMLIDQVTVAKAYFQFQSFIEQDPAEALYTPPSNEN